MTFLEISKWVLPSFQLWLILEWKQKTESQFLPCPFVENGSGLCCKLHEAMDHQALFLPEQTVQKCGVCIRQGTWSIWSSVALLRSSPAGCFVGTLWADSPREGLSISAWPGQSSQAVSQWGLGDCYCELPCGAERLLPRGETYPLPDLVPSPALLHLTAFFAVGASWEHHAHNLHIPCVTACC